MCALSGKIMFRDVVYITHDYSLRIQDGWVIFRWWRAYVPKDVSEGMYQIYIYVSYHQAPLGLITYCTIDSVLVSEEKES